MKNPPVQREGWSHRFVFSQRNEAEMLVVLQRETSNERALIRLNFRSLHDIRVAGQIRFDLIAIGLRGAR